jgi:hypothetical protein
MVPRGTIGQVIVENKHRNRLVNVPIVPVCSSSAPAESSSSLRVVFSPPASLFLSASSSELEGDTVSGVTIPASCSVVPYDVGSELAEKEELINAVASPSPFSSLFSLKDTVGPTIACYKSGIFWNTNAIDCMSAMET